MIYTQSNTISLVLSWLVSIPIIITLSFNLLVFVAQATQGPRLLMVWVGLCFLVFSPVRYIIFQLFLAFSYPFQSGWAFVSSLLLFFYVPLVASALSALGLGLPLLLFFWVAGGRRTASRASIIVAAIGLPWCCQIGAFIFFALLPHAAISVHWLRAPDVIRATNGPAYYAYSYLAKFGRDVDFPVIIEPKPESDRDYLRAHVANVYLSESERRSYFERARLQSSVADPAADEPNHRMKLTARGSPVVESRPRAHAAAYAAR